MVAATGRRKQIKRPGCCGMSCSEPPIALLRRLHNSRPRPMPGAWPAACSALRSPGLGNLPAGKPGQNRVDKCGPHFRAVRHVIQPAAAWMAARIYRHYLSHYRECGAGRRHRRAPRVGQRVPHRQASIRGRPWLLALLPSGHLAFKQWGEGNRLATGGTAALKAGVVEDVVD